MDYAPYLQKAFRTVVHDILVDVAKHGVQGETHYFITFQTNRSDVTLPDFVRQKYPEEMSIVLQHQFANLIVHPDSFRVDLSFGGVPSTLRIPFVALTQFVDPSVQFGLTLQPVPPVEETAVESDDGAGAEIIDLAALRRK